MDVCMVDGGARYTIEVKGALQIDIGGDVMLGGICHSGRTWLTIGVGTLQR